MNKNVSDRLIKYFLQKRAHGLQYRQYFEQDWREDWLGYMNKTPSDGISNEHFRYEHRRADEFRLVETLSAQYVLGLFSVPNWLHVSAPSGPGAFYEKMCTSLLKGGWDRSSMTRKTASAVKYATITGHAIMKSYWERTVADREHLSLPESNFEGEGFDPKSIRRSTKPGVVFDGPQHEFPDLFNCIFDPTGMDMWFAERRAMSKSWLTYRNSQFSDMLYDKSELKKVKAAKPMDAGQNLGGFVDSNGSWTSGPWDSAQLIEYAEGIPEQRDPDTVDFWDFWAWVPPEVHKYDDTQWRLINIINDEHLVRDVPAPTPDRHHPYDHISATPVPGRLYGVSVLTMVRGMVRQRTWLENARTEDVAQKLWQPMIVDGNVGLSPEKLFRRPGGVLFADNLNGRLSDHFHLMPQNDVFPSTYHEPALLDDQISRTSGATDPFEGNPAGGRTTATEINIIAQLGSSRFQLAIMNIGETLVKRALQRDFGLYQTRLTQKQTVELAGVPKQQYNVDMSALLWDLDIRLDIGRYGSFDENQFQRLTQIYALAAGDPAAAPYLNRENLLYDMFMRAGDDAVDRHVNTQAMVDKQNVEAQQSIQQQQQNEVAGQQAVDVNRELARGLASTIGGSGGEGGAGESLAGGIS